MAEFRTQYAYLLNIAVNEELYIPFPPALIAVLETVLHERHPQRTDAEYIHRWRGPIQGGLSYVAKRTGRTFRTWLHPGHSWAGAVGLVIKRLPDR